MYLAPLIVNVIICPTFRSDTFKFFTVLAQLAGFLCRKSYHRGRFESSTSSPPFFSSPWLWGQVPIGEDMYLSP
jgi:hypothetical protein